MGPLGKRRHHVEGHARGRSSFSDQARERQGRGFEWQHQKSSARITGHGRSHRERKSIPFSGEVVHKNGFLQATRLIGFQYTPQRERIYEVVAGRSKP